jgi:beta-glucosidase/6-phospho-beta-glucosidase/beta-galactosidase
MDLNYLYQRYAISLQMSENAACSSSRIVHRQMADAYRAQIAEAKIHGSAQAA